MVVQISYIASFSTDDAARYWGYYYYSLYPVVGGMSV